MEKHKNIYCHKTLGVIGHKVLMEACMVRACHTPQRPLQNHPSGHLGGWAMAVVGRGNTEWTSKSGQNYLPIPEPLTRASCRKDWKVISAESSLMSLQLPNRSRNWTELTHGFCEQSKYLACCIKGKHTSYWCRWHDGILWCSVVNLFSFFKFIYFFNFFFYRIWTVRLWTALRPCFASNTYMMSLLLCMDKAHLRLVSGHGRRPEVCLCPVKDPIHHQALS